MKSLEIIIVLCLIIFTYQDCSGAAAKKEDCKAENLGTTEKNEGNEYCCYVEYGDYKLCEALTKYQYENIKDYAKIKKLIITGNEDTKIDCKSLYLEISVLSILLLLL